MKHSFLRKPLAYSQKNTVFWLVGINLAVFLVTTTFPRIGFYLALIPSWVVNRLSLWQLGSYMFVHAGFQHIFFNMLGLLLFGMAVERAMGSREFLLFYLLNGFLVGLFSFGFAYLGGDTNVPMVGASGAIYSVLLAYAVYYPRSKVYIMGIIPIKAPVMVGVYAVLAIIGQMRTVPGTGGTAHYAHLAGFIFAFLYFVIRFGVNPIKIFRSGGTGDYS